MILCAALLLATPAQSAQDWVSRLKPPAAGTYWRDDEPPVLQMPTNLPSGSLDRLTLWVDGQPASVSWERSGNALVLRLAAPLAVGRHQLLLLETPENAESRDRGAWQIEVRPARAGQAAKPNRWSQAPRWLESDTAGQGKLARDPTGQGKALVKKEQWEAEVRSRRQSLDRQAEAAGQTAAEEYQMQLRFRDEKLVTEGQLGSFKPDASSLVVDGAEQPGAALSVETANSRAKVTGFARSRDARLTDDPASAAARAPDRQIQGSQVTVKPVERLKDNLEVTGTYFRGEVSENGAPPSETGDGWSLATETRWAKDRLRLRGEMARTRRNDGEAAVPVEGEAFAGMASVAILEKQEVGEGALDWDLSLEAERVDNGFASLANPSVQDNHQVTSLSNLFTWREFSLEARGSERFSNIEALPDEERARSRSLNLAGRYAPGQDQEAEDLPVWIGRPTLGLSLGVEDSLTVEDGSLELDSDLANARRAYDSTLELGTDYQHWGWTVSQSLGTASDDAEGDTVSMATGLGARFDLGQRFAVTPNGRYKTVESVETEEAEQTWELGLKADMILLPDTLTGSINYAYATTWDLSSQEASQALGGELVWRIGDDKKDRSALDLSVSGAVEERWEVGLVQEVTRDYQFFLNLRVTLPD